MKITLSENEIANYLMNDEYARWSYEGAKAIAEYLYDCDEESGEDTEFDCVSIRCAFKEFSSCQEWAKMYFGADYKEKLDINEDDYSVDAIMYELQENHNVILFNGGLIVEQS